MCGIAGVYGRHDGDMLTRMGASIAHRGPDGEGFHSGGRIGFAFRRLAIIDREHGDQPFRASDGRYVAVYNGEVYNFRELRDELEAQGRTFNTHCDTEVVVQAFAQSGEAVFDRFNGMFAVAIYDNEAETLTLARDHFGIKPLYFAKVAASDEAPHVVFGSEIKALLASGLVKAAPNDRVLYRYLRFRVHEDNNETFFAGIEKLQPGELMVIGPNGVQRRMFTTLREDLMALAKRSKPYGPAQTEEFHKLLTEAIHRRLVSEVPVGTALSGGLDSSTVVVTISKLMAEHAHDVESVGDRQQTFSAVFPGSVNDEERYVDAVVEGAKGPIVCHKVKPNPDQFLDDLVDFVRTQEEPTISTGPYAQYQVMRKATDHVTVLLDGQGADEMMAGYLPYYFVYLRQLRKQKLWTRLAGELRTSTDVLWRYGQERAKATLRLSKPAVITRILTPSFKTAHAGERFEPVRDDLKARLVEDIFHNSLPSLLRYEDRNTMRFLLEGRVPFLDFELMRFLFSLDDQAIIQDGWNKRVLRDALDRHLPATIVRRRNKIGFTTPEREWFLRIKNYVHGVFSSSSFGNRPYFDQTEVLRAFQGFISGHNSDTMLFWRLLNVELWFREYIDDHTDGSAEEAAQAEIATGPFDPNPGKQLELETRQGSCVRYPVRTDLFARGDDPVAKVSHYAQEFAELAGERLDQPWYLAVSEKAIAIAQGRSSFVWEIKPGRAAKILNKQVSRTPAGIGLGSPETMQLAIEEAGLPRILAASAVGAVGKVLGKKGWFYRVAGPAVRAIDGPTQYSLFPSNVSAKRAPKDPDKVSAAIAARLRQTLPEPARAAFQGVAVIDANDLGCNVLGQATSLLDEQIATAFKDNPLGQGSQQTPLAVVVIPLTPTELSGCPQARP